ncbi:MAG: UbiA family prenyltransferase, partial [Desulfobacterales bacterium]|nr:UbiA family prenyltransferase [Desulfobacterales bacterium]
GFVPFLILLAMSIMGFLYSFRMVPSSQLGSRLQAIRKIPGSKTILIALAWGIIISATPALSALGKINLSTFMVFLWISGMVFVRTAFFDVMDIQGDRIVGKETIPIYIGEKNTRLLLKYMLTILFAVLFLAGALNMISPLGYVLNLYPLYLLIVLTAYEHRYVMPGVRLGFLIESGFFLAGIITWVWSQMYLP